MARTDSPTTTVPTGVIDAVQTILAENATVVAHLAADPAATAALDGMAELCRAPTGSSCWAPAGPVSRCG